MGSIAFDGSILAPYANFTGSYGQIDGELIALSAAGTTQLNNDVFSGYPGTTSGGGTSVTNNESPTPEPSTWVLFASGLAITALVRRRLALV